MQNKLMNQEASVLIQQNVKEALIPPTSTRAEKDDRNY
jgi:hypothetical protein